MGVPSEDVANPIIRLCGHATLASAFVMKEHAELLADALPGRVIFHTLSGPLRVDMSSADGIIKMDFAADEAADVQPMVEYARVAEAIGVTEVEIMHIEMSKTCGYAVIEVSQGIDVESLSVDSLALVHCQVFQD